MTHNYQGHRSTRGFAVGDVVNGKTVQPLPAVDIEPQRGSSKKFLSQPPIVHDGMHHVADDGQRVTGVSRTASASALQGFKLPTDPQVQHRGKQLPIPACHSATPGDPERGTYDPSRAGKVIGSAIISGSTKLPESTDEQS